MKSILVCSAILGIGFSSTLSAAPFHGIFWSVPATTANNVPTLGNTPGPGAVEWGTFDTSSLQFSGDSNYTLGGFLNSFGAASNIAYLNGASGTTDLTNVLFEFTGTAVFTNGVSSGVLHDDGVNLYVNGALVVGSPGPTGPVTSTYVYNGVSGPQPFDFIYANGPASQADFQTALVAAAVSTPEPSAFYLLPIGLVALGILRMRLRRLAVF